MLILFLLAFNLCKGIPLSLYRNQVCVLLCWNFMAMCILVSVPDLHSTKQERRKEVSIKMAATDGSQIQCNRKQIRLSKLLKIYSSG